MQKNRFEKFARIFSRRHEQTTFSDADFLGVLKVKGENIAKKVHWTESLLTKFFFYLLYFSLNINKTL